MPSRPTFRKMAIEHRQVVLGLQIVVAAIHVRPQSRCRVWRLDLKVDQGKPLLRLLAVVAGNGLPGRHFGDEVENSARPIGRVGENLLLEPLRIRTIEAGRPRRKEQVHQFAEKHLDERLKSLIVVLIGHDGLWEENRGQLE